MGIINYCIMALIQLELGIAETARSICRRGFRTLR